MKPKLLLLAIIGCINLLMGQSHELKINVSNLIFYESNINYEYELQKGMSLGFFASYVYGFSLIDDTDYIVSSGRFQNKHLYFGPEFRYYVNPKNTTDGFFLGVYLKEAIGNIELYTSNGNSNIEPFKVDESNYNKMAGGISAGRKWQFGSNFTMEFFGAFGRIIYSDYANTSLRDAYFDNDSFYEFFDFRIGFNLGYKF